MIISLVLHVRSSPFFVHIISGRGSILLWRRSDNTHTHTHPFNGPFSRTARVSRYHKGKTILDFTEARLAMASAGPYANLHLAPDR